MYLYNFLSEIRIIISPSPTNVAIECVSAAEQMLEALWRKKWSSFLMPLGGQTMAETWTSELLKLFLLFLLLDEPPLLKEMWLFPFFPSQVSEKQIDMDHRPFVDRFVGNPMDFSTILLKGNWRVCRGPSQSHQTCGEVWWIQHNSDSIWCWAASSSHTDVFPHHLGAWPQWIIVGEGQLQASSFLRLQKRSTRTESRIQELSNQNKQLTEQLVMIGDASRSVHPTFFEC